VKSVLKINSANSDYREFPIAAIMLK